MILDKNNRKHQSTLTYYFLLDVLVLFLPLVIAFFGGDGSGEVEATEEAADILVDLRVALGASSSSAAMLRDARGFLVGRLGGEPGKGAT